MSQDWSTVASKQSLNKSKARERQMELKQQLTDYLHNRDVGLDGIPADGEYVPETPEDIIGGTPSTEQPSRPTDVPDDITNLPAYSAWLRRATEFTIDPRFHSQELALINFDTRSADRVVLGQQDITPINRGWGSCLLGRFAGRFPGKDAINNLMKRWPCKSRVTYHRKGWLCFQFGSNEDREAVRQKGPFEIFGIPLVLQPMPEKFDPNMEPEVNIPLWIRLVDLPLALWNLTAVSKIASCFGTALSTDFGTLRRDTLDGPRVQVIVNTSERPKTSITIEMPGGHHEQRVEFEFFPKFCRACKIYGHFADECRGSEKESTVAGAGPGRSTRPRSASRPPWVQRGRTTRQAWAQGPVARQPGPGKGVLGEGPSNAARSRSRNRREWRAKGMTPSRPLQTSPTRTPGGNTAAAKAKGAERDGIPSSPNRFEALAPTEGDDREDPHLDNATMEPLPVGPNDQLAMVTELLTAALSPILAGLKPNPVLQKPRSVARRDPRPSRRAETSDSDFPQMPRPLALAAPTVHEDPVELPQRIRVPRMPSTPAPVVHEDLVEVPLHVRAPDETWAPAAETLAGIMAETSATENGDVGKMVTVRRRKKKKKDQKAHELSGTENGGTSAASTSKKRASKLRAKTRTTVLADVPSDWEDGLDADPTGAQ